MGKAFNIGESHKFYMWKDGAGRIIIGEIVGLVNTYTGGDPMEEFLKVRGKYESVCGDEPERTFIINPTQVTWSELLAELSKCPACGRPWDMVRNNACECGAQVREREAQHD
jgi:hypothetical protein